MSQPQSQSQNSDIGQMIFANRINDSAGGGHSNPASGFAVSENGMNGMSLLGKEGVDSSLFGETKGISLGFEEGAFGNLIESEGALNSNLVAGFEKFLPGLTKSECFAIKSMGMLATLNSLSIKSQLSADIKGKTSVIGRGEQGG